MMKKNFSKALSGILTMALLLSVAVLPGTFHVSAANEFPTVKSEIALKDEDEANEGTLAKYDLLADPSEGLSLETGDTYVFDMDILANSYNSSQGGTAKPFGFDLLGNPTKSDNGAEVKLAGLEFANKRVLRWIPAGSWNVYASDDEFTIWGGGDYHYRFTVKAYESIQVEFWFKNTDGGYQNEAAAVDVTVAWSDIYGLSAVKAGDGTLFYPNMAFLDQNGKISNVAVRYTGTNGVAIKTAKKITLTDTDTANEGTLTKYDLLKDPSEGLAMEKGETYVFDMDIKANSYNSDQGGTAKPFGFDLLGNPTKSDNGLEIKLAGVEFSNKNALYWIANGAWSEYIDQSQPFTIWGGGNYHYRFTIKAYESIRVEFCYSEGYNAEKKGFDATVAWDQVYGLSTVKPGDGTLFYPNMTFLDQNGEISNISAHYSGKYVTIKTVNEVTLTDTDADNEGTMTKYDLLKDPTAGLTMEEGGTYVFEMNVLAKRYNENQGGTAKVFGFDLLGNPTKQGTQIKLSGIEFSNKNVLYWIDSGAWESFIDKTQPITLWGGGTYHYRFTVNAYESIQVEIWTANTANIDSNYPDSTVEYNATVEWSKVYGLSTVKAGDGTRFYPNMTFLDQDGEITNIHAVYIPAAKDVVIEHRADISAYRTAGAYTAPTKAGYVFAGWFTDAEATNPVTNETTNVYAKFAPKAVLSVKGQLKAGTTAESENTDYRFSTTVDSLNYQNIGFNITINGNTKSPSSTTVYKQITARTGDEVIAHDPTVFSAVSQYFHTYTITGIPDTAFSTEIKVAAYWTTLDGTKVTGPARTLTVNMGIN